MNAWPAIALATIAGCTWGTPPAPAVVGVAPTSIMAGEVTVLSVTVSDLEGLHGAVDFDDPSGGTTCDWFRIDLRGLVGGVVPLEEVVRVGAGELRGRVPASAPRDVYDVLLIDPSGREASLSAVFRIDRCPPGTGCRDGDPCTTNDVCFSANVCGPGTSAPDGTDCTYHCTRGDVPGTCAAAVCVPAEGACPPAPTSCSGE